jgi:hypothetical protein
MGLYSYGVAPTDIGCNSDSVLLAVVTAEHPNLLLLECSKKPARWLACRLQDKQRTLSQQTRLPLNSPTSFCGTLVRQGVTYTHKHPPELTG